MRKLDFSGDAELYGVMYDGIVNNPRGFTAPIETRIVGKVLDRLEAIGELVLIGPDIKSYRLNGKHTDNGVLPVILLEEEEYRLIKEALGQVKWNAVGARRATALFDMLEAATEVKPEEAKK